MKESNSNQELKRASNNGKIHFVLSHSYLVYFLAVVLGVIFDLIFPLRIFMNTNYNYVGLTLIVFGSLVIYWAQSTSAHVRKIKNEQGEHPGFNYGPYKYLRSPTHFGLFVMTLGLAILIQSPFSVIFAFIALIITKLFFLRKEEQFLSQKYGEAYISYKKRTKNHI